MNTQQQVCAGVALAAACYLCLVAKDPPIISLTDKDFEAICNHYKRAAELRDYHTNQVSLYFDQNDEFCIEEQVPEIISHRKQVAAMYDRFGVEADGRIEDRWA